MECICREHACLGRSDTREIHSLVRKFRAEAKKSVKVMGNGALVEKFMGCFTPTFADVIDERLIVKYGHYKDPTRNRHKDDKYDLSEVLSIVGALIDGSFARSPGEERSSRVEVEKGRSQSYPKDKEAEEKMAQMQDTLSPLGNR